MVQTFDISNLDYLELEIFKAYGYGLQRYRDWKILSLWQKLKSFVNIPMKPWIHKNQQFFAKYSLVPRQEQRVVYCLLFSFIAIQFN